MSNLIQSIPHLITVLIIVASVTALALDHVLTGGEALPVIASAGGFSLGGIVATRVAGNDFHG